MFVCRCSSKGPGACPSLSAAPECLGRWAVDVRLIQTGDYGGREFVVDANEFVLGRELSCHLRLDYAKVSLRHCRLMKRAGRVLVEDLNSTNGTAVNDNVLERDPCELHDGDELRVGPVHFRISIATDRKDVDDRIESVLASAPLLPTGALVPNISSDSGIVGTSPAMESAKLILDRLRPHASRDDGAAGRSDPNAPGGKRAWLEVAETDGVAVVKVVPRGVVDDRGVRRLSEELGTLIDAGKSRIALNLGNVEHLSSQAVGAVLQVHRRCQAGGGALKICTVRPKVAEIFSMTNLERHIEINEDEWASLASPWPEPTAASRASAPKTASPPPKPSATDQQPTQAASHDLRDVRLIVEVGRAKGQAIEVKGSKFVIGRDPRCQLRPSSELISRLHAAIEQRDGKVFVRDFGTKNGTILNDRALHGEEAEAADGDHLRVGLLQFSISISDRPGAPHVAKGEDEALAFLLSEKGQVDSDASTLYFMPTSKTPTGQNPAPAGATGPPPAAETGQGLHHISVEQAGDVLIVTIISPELGDEATVAPVRYDMQTLLDRVHPPKLLVGLERIRSISQRAVGVLLAISQRVERAGGAIRLYGAQPEIMPVLEAARLTQMTDLYESRDEALAAPWV
jgi:anti-anti-sigma factor